MSQLELCVIKIQSNYLRIAKYGDQVSNRRTQQSCASFAKNSWIHTLDVYKRQGYNRMKLSSARFFLCFFASSRMLLYRAKLGYFLKLTHECLYSSLWSVFLWPEILLYIFHSQNANFIWHYAGANKIVVFFAYTTAGIAQERVYTRRFVLGTKMLLETVSTMNSCPNNELEWRFRPLSRFWRFRTLQIALFCAERATREAKKRLSQDGGILPDASAVATVHKRSKDNSTTNIWTDQTTRSY